MSNLPNKYDHKATEKKWQDYWKKEKTYKWYDDKPRDQTFVIDTPPPTVSGLLHMGHVFSYSQADFIARYQRMIGKDVFYPMGFDDNGLPTERLVEKVIKSKAAIFEAENGSGSFVEKCREIVHDAEEEFETLFNQIALSVDWDQKYQTISDETQKISQASFIDLYHKNLVEKKSEPVFWDIVDRTALAQADLVDKEIEGAMHDIIFKDENAQDIIIMTTRPELLPACVALMINPDDEKYQHLILNQNKEGFTGSYAITAHFGVRVPIIADKLVQMDKGTGAVMCCTFGDETDILWWRKHNLELRVILGKDGRVSRDNLSAIFAADKISDKCQDFSLLSKKIAQFYGDEDKGRGIKQAKEYIVERLKEQNILVNHKPIKHVVKCAERSGVKIEILVQPQWFIKILDKKEQLKAKAQECSWYPDFMRIRIEQWIDGISWDWCISRQRFFGVKFPVWRVCEQDNPELEEVVVANINELPIDPLISPPEGFTDYQKIDSEDGSILFKATKNGKNYLIYPEADIMDTWATSSISPQLSSHGISDEIYFDQKRHQKLFPADLRPQAHEIIRSWAFYTIVKAMLHEDKIPWKSLMISGWCLASDKTKMSKSKGNVITPTSLIEEKGSDVVRYWAANSHLGADTAYSEDVFKIGHKLITKLFNAAKFASMNFDKVIDIRKSAKELVENKVIFESFDLWILSRLSKVIKAYQEEFDKYQYAKALEVVEDFFWNDFCDNYLEICKVRSYGSDAQIYQDKTLSNQDKQEIEAQQLSAASTLYYSLKTVIKLFAPFIPHICEEIYSQIFSAEFSETKSIHARSNFPDLNGQFLDNQIIEVANQSLAIIAEVRKWKSDRNISMKSQVEKIQVTSSKDLSRFISDLKNVCNAKEIDLQIKDQDNLEIRII